MHVRYKTARACSKAALALLIAAMISAGCGSQKETTQGQDASPSAEPTPSASKDAASPSADAKTEKPAETSTKPAEASKKPAETSTKPAATSEKPADTSEKPAESSTKPDDDAAKEDTVKVEASNWEWKLDKTEFTTGHTVKFEVTGKEGMHAFSIVGTDIKETVDEGKTTTITWKPDKAGEYVIKCALFCGTGHSSMQVKINVK